MCHPQLILSALKDREILVIDDDDDFRAALSRLLREAGARVTTAADTVEALPMAGLGVYEVVIAALRGTDREGVDFVRSVKGGFPRTRILVVTPDDCENGDSDWIRRGADVHVRKPFTVQYLLGVIEAALSRNRPGREYDRTPTDTGGRHVVPGGRPLEGAAGPGG